METGLSKFDFDDVNPEGIITSALDGIHGLVHEGVEISQFSDVPKGLLLRTDLAKMTFVMTSLLRNACKFTESGYIRVGCTVNENKGKVTFFVEDTGCGIPEDKAEVIFHRFVKLNSFKPGIGLGLSIDRLVVRGLLATLKLDTKYKGGSRFVIIHPIKPGRPGDKKKNILYKP